MNDTDRHPVVRDAVRALIALTLAFLPACQWSRTSDELIQCRNELDSLREENTSLKERLTRADRTIAAQKEQIANLQTFPPEVMEKLVTVDRIKLDKLTGGYDDDDNGVDEGVVAYIQPVDADGHAVKVAGKVTVRLFDLSSEAPVMIGKVELDADKTRDAWHSRLWTDYFAVRCPFDTVPDGSMITVKAAFTELLTGKEFAAQTHCEVGIKR